MTQLAGLHLLVTRPEDAGKELTHTLITMGAEALHESMFSIVPTSSQTYAKSFINMKPDLILATSVYAVKTAGAYISQHHKSWHTKVPVIGIGPATAGALHAQGWRNVSYPKIFNSEGILEMRATARVRGKTLILLTGAHGRNILTTELTERGARVIQVDGYERQPQNHISKPALDLLAKQPALVVLTSVEAWQTLEQLITPTHPKLLARTTFVVASKRIAEAIWQRHRHQQIIVASNASNAAIVAAITPKDTK